MSAQRGQNFNKAIEDCAKAIKLDQPEREGWTYDYKTEAEYTASVKKAVGTFKLTEEQKRSIEVIMYNSGNNDGVAAASIVYHYLKSNGKRPELLPMRPGWAETEKRLGRIRNKKVIMLDIGHTVLEHYKKMEEATDTLFIIDDHGDIGYKSPTYFTSNNTHAACACTWVIFYPDQPIPLLVQMIDMSDSKKRAKYFGYSNFLAAALAFRFTSNPYKPHSYFQEGGILDDFWDIMEGGKEKLLIVMGKYMDEAQENIKEQIARNAVVRDFQGYKVGVLNFADPVVTKRVGRQIISNMNRHGHKIDFAVLWAYEHNKEMYKITLIDDHKQTKVNMGELAKKLGKIGGTSKGGYGHAHAANFYWPRKPGMDIWDLFKKKYI